MIKYTSMKKYLWSIVILMLTLVTFTACSDDEGDDSVGLEKTTWTGRMVDDGDVENIVTTFKDGSNGIQYAQVNTVDEVGNPYTFEVWTKLTYTFDGKKGTATAKESVMKIAGTLVEAEDAHSTITFVYDEKKNTITFDTGDGDYITLNKSKYQDIVFPTK